MDDKLRDPLVLVLLALGVVVCATVLLCNGVAVPGWFSDLAIGGAFGAAGVATPGKGLAARALSIAHSIAAANTPDPGNGLATLPADGLPDLPATEGLTEADFEPKGAHSASAGAS